MSLAIYGIFNLSSKFLGSKLRLLVFIEPLICKRYERINTTPPYLLSNSQVYIYLKVTFKSVGVIPTVEKSNAMGHSRMTNRIE